MGSKTRSLLETEIWLCNGRHEKPLWIQLDRAKDRNMDLGTRITQGSNP